MAARSGWSTREPTRSAASPSTGGASTNSLAPPRSHRSAPHPPASSSPDLLAEAGGGRPRPARLPPRTAQTPTPPGRAVGGVPSRNHGLRPFHQLEAGVVRRAALPARVSAEGFVGERDRFIGRQRPALFPGLDDGGFVESISDGGERGVVHPQDP